MGTLVANGSTLYRRSSKLVRTPITLTLQPVEMAYYSVAGSYNNQQLPNTGFIAEDTEANVKAVGYNMLQAYNNPRDSRQIWRQATTAHQPETVWYQGAFATSAPNINATFASCEAYIQLCAYKFQTPTNLISLAANRAKCKFISGGAVVGYQSAGQRSSNNVLWKNWPDATSSNWYYNFAVTTALGTPSYIAQQPTQSFNIGIHSSGEARGVRDLWGFQGTGRDGGIPTVSMPTTEAVQFGPSPQSQIAANINNGVWIVPYIYADITSSTSYTPFFFASQNGYWGCTSVWGLTLEVEFE